jgi:hypothetical protein
MVSLIKSLIVIIAIAVFFYCLALAFQGNLELPIVQKHIFFVRQYLLGLLSSCVAYF